MTTHIEELLTFTQETAVNAGHLVREKYYQPLEIRQKGFRDIVTDADIAAQKLITDTIQSSYPTHGFLTEEKDSKLPTDGDVIWVIDPIDGTTNYSRLQPLFCVSIAAQIAGKSVVGAIYDPMRNELFSAAKGLGSHLNGNAIQVSAVNSLEKTIVALDWSRHKGLRTSTLDILACFAHQVQVVRAIGSAALAMAWIAAGRFDVYLNFNLRPWDVAAADILINEAGGMLSDLYGNPLSWARKGMSGVSSNGRIHQSFLDTFQDVL